MSKESQIKIKFERKVLKIQNALNLKRNILGDKYFT
jgi:hypothetical protein